MGGVARMEVEKLLKVRDYVAWTGKECENGEQLINWKCKETQ